jgi:REP element-mobilizing transposase RayT
VVFVSNGINPVVIKYNIGIYIATSFRTLLNINKNENGFSRINNGDDMSFVRVWIHFIWSTKDREKIINKEIKEKLLEHIKSNCKEKGIWLDTVNCVSDHIHLLISLGAEQTISKAVMLIKGESSHWINQNTLTLTKFEWQTEYMGVSVSESMVEKVRNYIRNQEEHHRKKPFGEEYDEFMKKYGEKIMIV